MTVDGVQENQSQISNEEHEHDATAKRTMLVDSAGNAISSTNSLPVNATISATLSVNLNEADDSVAIFGNDGASNQAILTDTTGIVQTHGRDQTGAHSDSTYGGIYGARVHIVGDGDKYVRGTIAEGSAVADEPVVIGAEDDSGNVANLQTDSLKNLKILDASQLVPKVYDYIALTYVSAGNGAGEVETITYKTGGAGGDTVATLTIAYNADDEISTITRS